MLTLHFKKLRERLPKRLKFFLKLWFLSTFLHILAICGLLMMCKPLIQHHHLYVKKDAGNNSVTMVLVPHIKTITGSLQKVMQLQTTSSVPVPQKKPVVHRKNSLQEKKALPSASKTNTTIAKQESPQKQSIKSKPQQQVIKNLVKAGSVPPKKNEKKKTELVQNNDQKKKHQAEKFVHRDNKITKPIEEKKEEIVYVGRNDHALVQEYKSLQQQIEHAWQPPVGIDNKQECKIKVMLTHDGKIHDIILEQSSLVISYDIAAQRALRTINYPKVVWGSAVVVTFNE